MFWNKNKTPSATLLLDNTCVWTGSAYYLKIAGSVYRPISDASALSWGFRLVQMTEEDFYGYSLVVEENPLGYRNGSLLHDPYGKGMYVVESSKLRLVQYNDMAKYGLVTSSAYIVSVAELSMMTEGEPIGSVV